MGQAQLQKEVPKCSAQLCRQLHPMGEIGPPRGSSLRPPKTRGGDTRAGDGSPQLGEKFPQPYRDQNKKKLSQPPLPLHAKRSSTVFTQEGQQVKEDHTWCLGAALSAKDLEARAPMVLCVLSPSLLSHLLHSHKQVGPLQVPTAQVTRILIQ